MRGNDIQNYKALPKAAGRIQLLWADDRFDGPLSGMCVYNGERLFFDFCAEMEEKSDSSRQYILFRLTAEQLEREQERQNDFVQFVGNHFSYPPGENKRRGRETMKPQSEWQKYYSKHGGDTQHDFVREQAIAWCADYENFWPEGILSPCFS